MGNKMGNNGQRLTAMGNNGQRRAKASKTVFLSGECWRSLLDCRIEEKNSFSSEITNSQAGSASSTASGNPDGMVWTDMTGC